MSAIPLRLAGSTATPQKAEPAGVIWVEVSDAARITGLSDRQLRRRCVEEWIEKGLARIDKGASGQRTYFIRSDADDRLSTRKVEKFDLMKFPEKVRNAVLLKEQIVREWQRLEGQTARGETEVVRAAFCAKGQQRFGVEFSIRTLHYWIDRYNAAGQEGLLDGRSLRVASGPNYPDYLREVEAAYLEQGEKKGATCHKIASAVCRRAGHPHPQSPAMARRHIDALKRKHAAKVALNRIGRDHFANAICAYDERDYEHWILDGEMRELLSNDLWCGDHHICDTICWAPRPGMDPDGPRTEKTGRFFRPWLTAWQDIRSRRLQGYYFADAPPTSTNVLLALRHGIIRADYGAPRVVYIDNGKDFDCWHLQGMTKWMRRKYHVESLGDGETKTIVAGAFGMLEIRVIHATPYNAKAKPVERWFNTYEDQFGKLQPTYCGKDPQHKPERLDHQLAAGRAPTFQEYLAKASAWIDTCYNALHNHSGHGMYGRTPDQVYAQMLLEKRAVHPDRLDACLAKSSQPTQVGRNGVTLKGRLYGMGDPSLSALQNQQVIVRYDPVDISWVSVWTLDGIHLADLDWNKRAMFGAISEEKWNQASRIRIRHNTNLREVAKRGMAPVRDNTEILLEDAEERLRQANGGKDYTPPNPPAERVKMVGTGVLPAASSKPLRKAVGDGVVEDNFYSRYADDAVDSQDEIRAVDLYCDREES